MLILTFDYFYFFIFEGIWFYKEKLTSQQKKIKFSKITRKMETNLYIKIYIIYLSK